MSARWLAALACCLSAGCIRQSAQAATGGPATATVFISSDMRGYLGPCGCSENMRGGIGRAAFQVLEARKSGTPVLYADCGDGLFPKPQLTPAEVPQEARKARALAEAMKLMGVAARTGGELDDAQGTDFRASLGLPDGVNGRAKVVVLSGHKIGLVSAQTGPELAKGAGEARALGAEFVVGLVHDSLESVLRYQATDVPSADIVVASHAPTPFAGEESRLVRSGVPAAQLQSKGRALLRLDLTFGGSGAFELLKTQADTERELAALDERLGLLKKQIDAPSLKEELKKLYQGKLVEIVQRRAQLASVAPPTPVGKNTFAARFVPLETALPEDPAAQALVTAYDQDVAKLNLAWAKAHGQDCPSAKKGEAAYAGSASCKECHAEAFPVWEASKHSHAYADLERAGKNYRVDCVRCHVVGSGAPGGVCRVDKVAGRKDVGCENCHGPGSLHVADPSDDNIALRPSKELCVGCHDLENSPHFDFGLYLPEILGPGHGKPLADGGVKKKH